MGNVSSPCPTSHLFHRAYAKTDVVQNGEAADQRDPARQAACGGIG